MDPELSALLAKLSKMGSFGDTLQTIAGKVQFSRRSPGAAPPNPDGTVVGETSRGGDTVSVYGHPQNEDHVLAHEFGHVVDSRKLAVEPMGRALMKMSDYAHPDDHYGSNYNEYAAEAFARAVESGRHGFTDSTQVDKAFPGSIDLIRWLTQRAPFAAATGAATKPAPDLVRLLREAQLKPRRP